MQTTFDGPFGAGTDGASHSETLVVMRTGDGGLELLAEDRTLVLSADDVRILLFYGSTVELESPGRATAAIGVDPRRYAVVLVLEGCAYHAPRWAITAVARGRLPVAYLQADRRPPPSEAGPRQPCVRLPLEADRLRPGCAVGAEREPLPAEPSRKYRAGAMPSVVL